MITKEIMQKNKNKQPKADQPMAGNQQPIYIKTLIILSVVIFLFSANVRPAYAIFGVGDISFTTITTDIPRVLFQIFDKIRQGAGARAYHQALRSVTYRLAQDSAVWLASGGKGRKPLVFQQSWGERLSDFGDQVAGKFLVNMSQGSPINLCSPTNVNSRLKLTLGVSKSIQDFDIFPDNVIDRDTGKTGCKLSDIGSNFQATYENQRDALKDLSKGFDIDKNPLGAFLVMREYVQIEKKKTEEEERLAREKSDYQAIIDGPSGQILTPGATVEEVQKSATRKAIEQEAVTTGDIFVDAFQIFANTFAQTYLRRLQQGMLKTSTSRSPGGLMSDFEGSPASRVALLAEYDAFSPANALKISGGAIDLIQDMIICPNQADPLIYQSPYHCLLTNELKQAVEQRMTVKAAVNAKLIPPETLFPEAHDSKLPNLSIENLPRLRFLRVIPVGWEIAAQRLGSNKISFGKLLECFEDPSDPDNNKLPAGCPGTENNGENILYHLVDPAWVLELPQHQCRAIAFSSLPEHKNSPSRQDICVDLASCIKEDENGNCENDYYGYCTRERVTWQINGNSCEPQFATCMTFTKPKNISLLTAYVDNEGCDSSNIGCKWYSMAENTAAAGDSPIYVDTPKAYLTSSALSCMSNEKGSEEVIILSAGVNIIKNGDFAEELIAYGNDRPAVDGGWQFTVDVSSQYLREQQAVNGPVSQELKLKPFTYYNLSFDILDFGSASNAEIEIDDPSFSRSISSDDENIKRHSYNFDTTDKTITITAELFFNDDTGGEVAYDNVQIIEININDLEKYENAVPAFRKYGYDSQGRDLRQVFKNVDSCDAEEASAREYTKTADSSVRYARLLVEGLCSAQCDGMDSFLAMPTDIEKLASSSAIPERASFIPKFGQSCAQESVGCEVFTNMSAGSHSTPQGAQERREYYSRIESCVMDTNPNIATFYTWEAGQLKVWQLLKDSVSGPCVDFEQGQISNPETETCVSAVVTCDSSTGALCRTFIDETGTEHFRDANKIVTASSQCTEFRRTEVQGAWYFIPNEANQCSSSAVGCRQYKGKLANNSKTVFESTFEDLDGGGLSASDALPWVSGTVVAQSINEDEQSYKIQQGANDIGILDYASHFDHPLRKNFRLTFKAKADADGGIIDLIRFKIDPVGAPSGATDKTFVNTSNPLNLTTNWREYSVGPFYYTSLADVPGYGEVYDIASPSFFIRAQNSDVFIDDIKLEEVQDNYYFIEQSILPKEEGGNQPNACFSGISPLYNQCYSYKDSKNNTYYVQQFDKLFQENAMWCTPVIKTHNYTNPYSYTFNNPSPDPSEDDDFSVPADEFAYLTIKAENKANNSSAGCTELGLPKLDSTGAPIVGEWRTVYKVIDPDNFNSTLCNKKGDRCEEFVSLSSGKYYFRDPGEKLCKWDSEKGQFGDFVDKDGNACNFGLNASHKKYVPECSQQEDTCTAYAPLNPELTEGTSSFSFMIDKQVNSGNCNDSAEDIELGCVRFEVATSTTELIPAQYNPEVIPKSRLISKPDRTIEVKQTRECAEWLAPTTLSQAQEPSTKKTRTVTYDLGRCQKLNPAGDGCIKWVTPAHQDYPEAYKDSGIGEEFNYDDYQNRYIIGGELKNIYNGAWDYSGYSIPELYPVELLEEQESGGVFKLGFAGAPLSENENLVCRGYPEEDSPFNNGSAVFGDDYNAGIKPPTELSHFNLCWEEGDACECTYKKVEAVDNTVYLSKSSIRVLPEETRKITEHEGWYGYCLERAGKIKNPDNASDACMAWWPIDVVQGKPNVFDNHPEAGFSTSQPLYYCLAGKGNKIEYTNLLGKKSLFLDKAEDNNYMISVGKVGASGDELGPTLAYGEHFNMGKGEPSYTNDAFAVPIVLIKNNYKLLKGVEYQPEYQSGNMYFAAKSASPLYKLHEYDIESIILKVRERDGANWMDNGTEFLLGRQGNAYSSLVSATTEEEWSALWCGGTTNAKCEFGATFGGTEVNYTWDKFQTYINNDWCKKDKEDEDGVNVSIDSGGNTNIFALRAVFADANGSYIDFDRDGDGTPEPAGTADAEPYQFLGFEGGLCDNTGGDGWVEFQIIFQLREWCTDVAQVVNGIGENKAWSGRVNNQPQVTSVGFSVTDKVGSLDNLYGTLNLDNTITPIPFMFTQDSKPYGAIAPPTQSIYNPEEWDSRLNETVDEFDPTIKKLLEPDKQPLYVEDNNNQVRAGSPYSCSSNEACIFPPSSGGSVSALPSAGEPYRHAVLALRNLFTRIFGWWIWDPLKNLYKKQTPSLTGEVRGVGLDASSDIGQCPIIQAAQRTEAGYIAFSSLAILSPNTSQIGNCGIVDNYGRYSINGKPIEHDIGGIPDKTIEVFVGQEVKLEFYGYNFNGEQLPLKKITIDWVGVGTDEDKTIISGNFKNHRDDCSSRGLNYGQTDRACENEPFVFTHIYQKSGPASPIIILEDNWGRTTRASYNTSSNHVLKIKNFVAVAPPENLRITSPVLGAGANPNKNTAITFTWTAPPAQEGIIGYEITVKKNSTSPQSPTEIRQTGLTFLVSGHNDLKSFIFEVRTCTDDGCGTPAVENVVFKPDDLGTLTLSPDPIILDVGIDISWGSIELADRYELEFDQKGGSVAATSSTTTNTEFTYLYETNATHVRIRVRACNGSVCSAYADSGRLEYQPLIGIVSGTGSVSVDAGTALSHDIVLNKLSGEYTYSFSPLLPAWIRKSVSDGASNSTITLSNIPVLGDSGGTFTLTATANNPLLLSVTGNIVITVNSTCGNGSVQTTAGEQCDPNDPVIANYSVPGVSGGNSITKRCVPAGQTKGAATECQWWPDEVAYGGDGDGIDGKQDCQNHVYDQYMFIGSTEKTTTQRDYNCNGIIEITQGSCSPTGQLHDAAVADVCPGAIESEADQWCRTTFYPSASAMNLGGATFCNNDDQIRCDWCVEYDTLYN